MNRYETILRMCHHYQKNYNFVFSLIINQWNFRLFKSVFMIKFF